MKVISKALIIASVMSLLTSTSYAAAAQPEIVEGIRIKNENNYTIDVNINSVVEGLCTPYTLLHSQITTGGDMKFTHTMFSDPQHVCVHAYGKSSITGVGGLTKVNNVKECVVTVKDAGLMNGVKSEYSPECGVQK